MRIVPQLKFITVIVAIFPGSRQDRWCRTTFPRIAFAPKPEDRPEWVWRGHYADSQNCRNSRAANLLARSALLMLRIRALASCGGSLPFTTAVSSNGLLTCPNPLEER
jgi:hypothetical protein